MTTALIALRALGLCCPYCRGDLAESGDAEPELECGGCRRRYPVVAGIPDLRIFDDPYIDAAADRAKARLVAGRLGETDLAGLLSFYYGMTDVVPPAHARRYTAGLLTAGDRAAGALDEWASESGAPLEGRLLDLGCGTAPLLAAAAARCESVAGVDIAMRWLVVARQRLLEARVSAPLVCACAEALPFRDAAFDVVAGESVLEVVEDQRRAAAEAYRVLRPGGRLWLTTPNRRSLGPDPHIGVPAGGWWPNALLRAWARVRGAVPPRRHLLSAGELDRLAAEAGFTRRRVFVPGISAGQRARLRGPMRAAAGAYSAMRGLRPARAVLRLIGPLLGLTAERPAGGEQ